MTEDFWQGLKADFFQLRRECPLQPPAFRAYLGEGHPGDGADNPGWIIGIRKDSGGWGVSYLSFEGTARREADVVGYLRRFKWLAERGAGGLGFSGSGSEAASFWLERVAKDAPEALKSLPNQPEQVYLDDACYWSAHYCDRCLSSTSRGSLSPNVEVANASSRDTLTGLREGARDYPKLAARWHSKEKQWTLHSEGTGGDMPADPAGEKLFKELARAALALAGKSAGLTPPWWAWLDLLREGNRGFQRAPQLRSATLHSALRCLDEGLELPEQMYRLLEDGSISAIFRQSAELFEDMVPNLEAATGANPDRARTAESGGSESPGTNDAANKRLRPTVSSDIAARKMEAYMDSHGGQTAFAIKAGTTDRTLRSFRRTGRVRWDIFKAIADAMDTTPDELLKPK